MSVIVAFLFAISLWYLSSNHKVTFVKLKATDLKFLPNRSWHGLIPAGGTFVSATGGTFQSDTPGTFVSAMGGTFDSDIPGTFESATGGTFNPLLSGYELSDNFIAPNAIRRGKIMVSDDVFKDILAIRQRNFEKDIRTEELSQEYLKAPRYKNRPSMSRVIKSALDRKEEELSNGETGFQYFIEQIPYDSLVLLDEPENSLSAEWQVILAKELYNLATKGNCQMIIATHSPFILSLPDTKIYDLDSTPVKTAQWYELDNMKTYFQLFNAHRQEFEM